MKLYKEKKSNNKLSANGGKRQNKNICISAAAKDDIEWRKASQKNKNTENGETVAVDLEN
ncbi:MAG: hypothetical protein ACTSXL_06185 [Alphaproteobacteria bacterium]